MEKGYPKVVLVGRTNVGKSALFNRLANDAKSIVFEQKGVTRDYIHEVISWQGKSFNLIDSGGMPLGRQTDLILDAVQKSVLNLINSADLLLFVCDGKNGLVDEDLRVAKIIHQSKKKVFLLINKADNNAYEENFYEFQRLGFKTIFRISALHGVGIGNLLEQICENITTVTSAFEDTEYKISIVGKPNVGKSSLMNQLIHAERSIVSDIPGTTREAISEKISFSQHTVLLTDTAGIRRKKKIDDDLENIMVKSSLKSLRDADIVLLMVDASEGKLSDQELKLLFYAYEYKKCIVILFNKSDLLKEDTRALLEHELTKYDFVLNKVPHLYISCKEKKNLHKIHLTIQKIWDNCRQSFDPEKLATIVTDLSKKPLYKNEVPLKIYGLDPHEGRVPTFTVRVNYPQFFGPDQLGFVENVLRKHYDLKGCPVKLFLK